MLYVTAFYNAISHVCDGRNFQKLGRAGADGDLESSSSGGSSLWGRAGAALGRTAFLQLLPGAEMNSWCLGFAPGVGELT